MTDKTQLASSVGARVEEVIEAAQRAAEEIRNHADREGADLVARRREEADRLLDEQRRSLEAMRSDLHAALGRTRQEGDAMLRTIEAGLAALNEGAEAQGTSATAPVFVYPGDGEPGRLVRRENGDESIAQ